jgi:hypothetical protein
MRLHVVDAEQGDLPGYGEAFSGVEAGREVGSHARSSGYGHEVWSLLPDEAGAAFEQESTWIILPGVW